MLIVSSLPLVRAGLKLISEEVGIGNVHTASDDAEAALVLHEIVPSIIVLDRADTIVTELGLLQYLDYPVKVIVIGRRDDKITVYSRQEVGPATLDNLIALIKE